MTTLASAAAVLRCFSAESAPSDGDRRGGAPAGPKSNVSRLLRAMRDTGFVESVGATKRYRPGGHAFEAGHVYRRASSLGDARRQRRSPVSAQVGHSGYVSVRDGLDVVGATTIRVPMSCALRPRSVGGSPPLQAPRAHAPGPPQRRGDPRSTRSLPHRPRPTRRRTSRSFSRGSRWCAVTVCGIE